MSTKYHGMFSDILDVIENQSKCVRLKVASLIVKDDRIVSMGWNGTPPGMLNCNEVFNHYDPTSEYDRDRHHAWSSVNENHAEQNAIAFAARNGISPAGADMYVSISPCATCARTIIAAGIKNVYYKTLYDRSSAGIELLRKCGVNVEHIGD